MTEKDVSRRGFLKGAVVAGVAAATTGVLAGCSNGNASAASSASASASASEESSASAEESTQSVESTPSAGGQVTIGGKPAAMPAWDKEVDVLVVGGGTAMYAAVLAKDFGAADVAIMDKAARLGGTSITSGGVLWVPCNTLAADLNDSREDALAYMRAVAGGRGNDAAMEAYVDNGDALVQHMMTEHNWPLIAANPSFFNDYYEPFPGAQGGGGRQIIYDAGEGFGTGYEMFTALAEVVDELGIEQILNTAATDLVCDETGRVIGVIADQGGTQIAVAARQGVVLGTGGFDNNPEMINRFQAVKPYVTVAAPENTGDGQNMGAAIGAALGNMDTNWGLPSFYGEFDAGNDVIEGASLVDWGVVRAGAGSIIVNKRGKRFANEASSYPRFNRAFGNYATEDPGYVNLPAVWICDSKYVEASGGLLPGQFASDPGESGVGDTEVGELPDNMFEANTLEELAEHFGIDAAALTAEVEKFNGYAKAGVDEDFHRGETTSDVMIGALHPYVEGEEIANPVLAPLETPPFYGSLYVPGTCGTNGGLVINEKAQVLNTKGEVIEGLLAVGNCTASIMGGQYTGGGATLGAGAIMSYVGVKNLLGA